MSYFVKNILLFLFFIFSTFKAEAEEFWRFRYLIPTSTETEISINSNKYKTLSDKNQINVEILYPTRGKINDRNNKVLATNNKVYEDIFDINNESEIDHISLSRWADIILVLPTTANFMTKLSKFVIRKRKCRLTQRNLCE